MNKRCKEFLVLLGVALAAWLCRLPPAGADWPLIRGDAHARGVAEQPLGGELSVVWTFQAEESGFEAAASIVDGVVYVGDVDGTFYALRLDDGSVVWKRTCNDEVQLTGDKAVWRRQGFDTGFINGTAVVDGRVYATDYNGILRCLDAATGEPVWSLHTDAELYAAPNLHQGNVLLVTEAGELLCLDAAKGELRWKFAIDQPLRCWPTVAGGQALVAGCDARLYAIDVESGKVAEEIEISGPPDSMPAVRHGRVYFCTAGGQFHAISLKPFEPAWTFRHPGQGEQLHGAAVSDEAVVFGTHRKEVVALDPTTGEQTWMFRLKSRAESSPVIAGDRVFFGTIRGRFHAVDLQSGEEIWQYLAGGQFTASPAVSEGRLIIGNEDGTLYCFGGKTETPNTPAR